jgi:hypothetical protein
MLGKWWHWLGHTYLDSSLAILKGRKTFKSGTKRQQESAYGLGYNHQEMGSMNPELLGGLLTTTKKQE